MTPRSDVDLCTTCSHAFIREDYYGNRDVLCTWVHPLLKIKGPTVKCRDYRHKGQADVFDLEKIAWIITGNTSNKIGFKAWKDMSPEEREELGVRKT